MDADGLTPEEKLKLAKLDGRINWLYGLATGLFIGFLLWNR